MSASPTQSPELSRANPPAGPYFDLLDISGSPSSSSSPPAPLMAPIYPTSYGYHSSPPPITDYSIRLEKMSAAAIFAVLRLFPKGSVIGMDKPGNFTIYQTNNYLNKITTAVWRTWLGQNGDQLVHLIDPIKQACDIYDPSNKDVGFIFFIGCQGAQGLKEYYEDKDKPTVVASLAKIANIFLEHARTCHSYNPIPDEFRPDEVLHQHRSYPQQHYPPHSAPTSAPIPIPKRGLTNLEVPFWEPPALEKFATCLKKIICSPDKDELVKEKRLQKLLEMINEHTRAFSSRSYRSPYSGRR